MCAVCPFVESGSPSVAEVRRVVQQPDPALALANLMPLEQGVRLHTRKRQFAWSMNARLGGVRRSSPVSAHSLKTCSAAGAARGIVATLDRDSAHCSPGLDPLVA
jgi:hypothetical protein